MVLAERCAPLSRGLVSPAKAVCAKPTGQKRVFGVRVSGSAGPRQTFTNVSKPGPAAASSASHNSTVLLDRFGALAMSLLAITCIPQSL
ncbi:uncharacterized protein MEPE_04961 [Melanopsichium pennsylvanicum]|uniref:Uncharacterized protein n=1 Tax=Melanopsichium pennsylvanicum TaxID=63383 RepID=A0AAJ5C6V6_9BASI|nr:uncharacterized protein MEPE_04961 [Melanopsichium pennsylvanicum]